MKRKESGHALQLSECWRRHFNWVLGSSYFKLSLLSSSSNLNSAVFVVRVIRASVVAYGGVTVVEVKQECS